MDQKTFLALALCAAVYVIFEITWIGPQNAAYRKKLKERAKKKLEEKRLAEAKRRKDEGEAEPESPDKPAGPDAPKGEATGKPDDPEAAPELALVKDIPAGNKNFEGRLSNQGASLTSLTFKDIQNQDRTGQLQPLHSYLDELHNLSVSVTDTDVKLARVRWNYEAGEDGEHRFWRSIGKGRRVVKVIKPSDEFHYEVTLRFENGGDEDWSSFFYTLTGPAGLLEEYKVRAEELQGLWCLRDANGALLFEYNGASSIRDAEGHRLERLTTDGEESAELVWTGLTTKYFASILAPDDKVTREAVRLARLENLVSAIGGEVTEEKVETATKDSSGSEAPINQLVAQIVSKNLTLAPGDAIEHRFVFFTGPKAKNLLYSKTYEPYAFYKIFDYNYGMFSVIARPLSWLLGLFFSILGNYGFAILFTTLLVKAAMHPLMRKQQINMHRMQALNPELQKIQAKYEGKTSAEARQKMQMEQMQLYSKHGVNPLTGCLPMFLNFPVFIALYNVLNYSTEMRHAPFLFWIDDLSRADHLFTLPFKIPFHNTDAFSLLPIVMVGLYLANQSLQPKPKDAKQAEMQKTMRYVLPVIGFMFYTMPSGLLIYFITNTSVSMLETVFIRRQLEQEDAARSVAELDSKGDLKLKPAKDDKSDGSKSDKKDGSKAASK